MKAFPKLPNMEFGTTPKEMAQERTALVLQASVFDAENDCSMCSKRNPPCPGPSIKWIQCDSCNRWFHDQCVQRDTPQLEDGDPRECCFCKA
ncbi:lysine-specific demethylase 5B-B [Labeo rohita]|uniref:lysine-specific demethylase 5B-B n=1 Tax=Labeo rohita TaxID=84645 RepID=UPI0021E341E2|nr:lysine-specific demethylase 5B-B [Labeo rohita]